LLDYLATHSSLDRAEAFLSGIDSVLQRIAQFPQIGRKRNELYPNLRSLPYQQYLIFYRLLDDAIEVFRVVSGYQDLTAFTIRMPEDVIKDLKQVAPLLGFSGYQPLARAYIGQGLRADLEHLQGDTVSSLIASLKRHGVSDEVIQEALVPKGRSERAEGRRERRVTSGFPLQQMGELLMPQRTRRRDWALV